MKLLVETTGDFGLYDLASGQEVEAHRPTVVKKTPFIQTKIGSRLTVLEELGDDAEDEALAAAANAKELAAAIKALPRKRASAKDEKAS